MDEFLAIVQMVSYSIDLVTLVYYIAFILACPCEKNCINGCRGCENPICSCQVSLSKNDRLIVFSLRLLTIGKILMTVYLKQPINLQNVHWIVDRILSAEKYVKMCSTMIMKIVPVRQDLCFLEFLVTIIYFQGKLSNWLPM